MSIVDSILKEELQRLMALQQKYRASLLEYPSGAVSIKTKGGHRYVYRAFRDGQRIVTQYVGPEDSPVGKKFIEDVMHRRSLAQEIKAVIRDIVRINNMLHSR